jgi:hypothetical protein
MDFHFYFVINGHPFFSSEKNIFFEEKMSGYSGEDENNPNWHRYKAHFTY